MSTTPITRQEWAQARAFANRFDADTDAMNAEGAHVPNQLQESANHLTDLAQNIAFNGGVPTCWDTSPESIAASRAALRLIVAGASELGMFLDSLQTGEEAEDATEDGPTAKESGT